MVSCQREKKIIEDCLSGDRKAWALLVGDYCSAAYDFLASSFGPLAAGQRFLEFFESLSREDFRVLRLYREMSYNISLERFMLEQIASYFKIDPVRLDEEMEESKSVLKGLDMDHEMVADIIEKTIWEYFEECLRELPVRERVVFKLYLEGVVPEKIAVMCNFRSQKEVEDLVAGIKLRLKGHLGDGVEPQSA